MQAMFITSNDFILDRTNPVCDALMIFIKASLFH